MNYIGGSTMKQAQGSAWQIVMVVALVGGLGASAAEAQVVVMDFEGLQDGEAIDQYYNGGFGGSGSGPGPSLGTTFTTNGQALIDSDAGGTGDFGGEPSPNGALFWFSDPGGAVVDVPAGFTGGVSFYYSSPTATGFVDIYDGLGGSGNLLGSLVLPATGTDGGDPTGTYCPFAPIGKTFSGVARSIDFTGSMNQVMFDNLTLGGDTPVGPTPTVSALSLWGIVLAAALITVTAAFVIRRRRLA
jgi:hypothetical protein